MKKYRIISVVASLFMLTATFAQNVITADNASVRQGSSGDLVLKYQFDEANKYAAIELTISLPEGITLSTTDIIKGSCLDDKHGIEISSQEGNTYKLTCIANPTTAITGLSGTLMTLRLNADASLNEGADLAKAKLQGIILSTTGGTKENVDDSDFQIAIVSNLVTLNEESTVAPEYIEDVNVKVIRSIKANEWSTICLPFDMDATQVVNVFGNDVKIGDFTGCETTKEGENVTAIKVKFSAVTSIEANHPYIIKISAPVADFTVDNVNISPTEEPVIKKDEWITGKGTTRDPFVYHYNYFCGTYAANTEVPELALFLNGNKFWYSTGSTKMKAFRGYFDFYNVLTEVEDKLYNSNIILSFDEADGINNVTVGQPAEGIYDIQGRKVHTDENKWDNLKKGVYIINGKKVIK